MISKLKRTENRGFTLVELLIVIAIAGTLTVLLIPRLRMINQERAIREASRITGSMLATASQRAVTDGVAGVVFLRNPNFNADGLEYGCTEIALLRAVPVYVGDQVQQSDASRAAVSMGSVGSPPTPAMIVTVPKPLEQDELQIIKVGDSISLGATRIKYRIFSIDENAGGGLELAIDRGAGVEYLPGPSLGIHDFIIHRQPRILRSSVTSLPRNHMIDLRYSGAETIDSMSLPINVFEAEPVDAIGRNFINATIGILFNEQGALDRILYEKDFDDGLDGDVAAGDGRFFSAQFSRIIASPVFLFVSEISPEPQTATATSALDSEVALWVSASPSGSPNVGYSTAGNFTLGELQNFYVNDRPQFNTIIRSCRANSDTAAANQ